MTPPMTPWLPWLPRRALRRVKDYVIGSIPCPVMPLREEFPSDAAYLVAAHQFLQESERYRDECARITDRNFKIALVFTTIATLFFAVATIVRIF